MGFPPQLKDRLGALHPRAANPWARNSTYSTIPANETIVLLNWLELTEPPYTDDPAIGIWLFTDNPTVDLLYVNATAAGGQIFFQSTHDGGSNTLSMGNPIGPQFFALVLDRDNTNLEAWVNGVEEDTTALTQDPDFATACQAYLFGGSKYQQICWRGIILSLTNGSTPTQAQWADILTYHKDPDAPLHPILTAAKGSVYSDYYCGEGLDSATTLEDQGDESKDLTWQAAQTCEDARYRTQTPRRNTRRSFYSLKPGYTATTGNVDFGFSALIADEVRFLFDGMAPGNHVGAELTNAAGTHYVKVERSGGVPRIAVRAGGAVVAKNLSDDQFLNGGDITVGCIGSTAYVCISGQLVAELAMGASMDLSGNCVVNMDGDSTCCLVEGYNEFTTPGNFCDYICCTVQDPERTLLNLSTPLVSFPIRSDLVAAGGTTVANQGSGGGTLTLSAQRSTSCEIVRTGYDS
jgi:hypothetical protein